MGLCLFFLPNFPGATFIQGGTFIPDSRVDINVILGKEQSELADLAWSPFSKVFYWENFALRAENWNFYPKRNLLHCPETNGFERNLRKRTKRN